MGTGTGHGAQYQYFSTHGPPLLLNRIDYTARIAVKH